MKAVILLLLIHLCALRIVRAEEVKVALRVDECREVLPQLESDYRDLEQKYRFLDESSKNNQENYLGSFNQMTQVLFQLTAAREMETQSISQSRDQLRQAIQEFSEMKTSESSKNLQSRYIDLTTQLFTALENSQKTLETLKTQLGQVEATRNQYGSYRQQLEQLDQQKLAIEAKLVSLKIKCQPEKKYLNL